jgi:hypothetical protein
MDAEARKAAFAQTKVLSDLLLDPEAYRAAIAEEKATEAATRVQHRSDGYSSDWHAGMPKPEPTPQATALTDAETLRWQRHIDDRIAAALAEYHESAEMRPVTDAVIDNMCIKILNRLAGEAAEIDKLRAEFQKEIAKVHKPDAGQEFFYFDNGVKQDADLHNAIIGPVDNPVDERIMAPIRARHRTKWLQQQEARRRG